ncbi:MAG TPA: PAS domain S-box protein [Chloroflexaceae bacterium]|nr:PAS domain S-box protein [Chloroflexaceae bacterium]
MQTPTTTQHRTLAEAVPNIVWTTDAQGAVTYFSRRWYDYTGQTEAEALGFGFIEALHPDDRERTSGAWERAWRDGEPYEIEYRIRGRDGSYRWFIGRAAPVVDEAGQVGEWVGTCTDIDEQKRSREGLAFLAHASALLASSLDYEETLISLTRLAVPHIADWCAIDLREGDGTIRRLEAAHVDPAKVALAREIIQRYPHDPDAPAGVPAVIRSGRPEIVPVITEEMVRAGIPDPDMLEVFLNLGLRSSMVVPLAARGRAFGALTLVSAESGRYFSEADLRLAEDLARRAATAIEHAELYRELRQFRETLDRTADCVFMFDAETLRFFYVNQGAVEQVGYDRDELLGMTPLAIKPRYDEASFRAMIAPLIAGELPLQSFETVHRHKDGHEVEVEIALQYVDPPEGDPRFVAVGRDIGERKTIERALAEQAKTLRSQARLIDLAHEAIIVRDAGGTITSWNRGAEELYGWSAAAALGRTTHELLATRREDGTPFSVIEQSEILGSARSWEGELIHTRSDGRAIIVESRQAAVQSPDGSLQILEINRDVTGRKEAEEALRASERRYRALADAMPLLVWISDPTGKLIDANQPWAAYTGFTPSTLGPEGWARLVHPDDLELTARRWREAMETGGTFEVEQRLLRFDGRYRWHLVRAQAVHDAAGRVDYWVGTNTDIDEQKRAEAFARERGDVLARTTRLLEERNRELDQFAYITSHDLKAPLRGIANLAQWIEEDLGDHATDEIRSQLELLRGRAHRMEALIDGILQYSRVGRTSDKLEPVDVGELLEEVVDLLAPPPEATITVGPGMPTLLTDRVQLSQVFANLIGNALKHHGGPDATVTVSARTLGDGYEFAVADRGPGIAPQYHDRIFGIFQTLASRDRVEGSGLGLALVKKMVERQGGQIRVESEEGQGATFFFTWPAGRPEHYQL